MTTPERTPPVYRLDEFEVDLRAGELRRNGVRVPLQDLPLRLLGILADHAGQVVTREEIQQRLWPGETFVDFEDGLNTAIRKLRQALDEDARQPRLIETIRGYGYRLLVPVELIQPPGPRMAVAPDATDSPASDETAPVFPATPEVENRSTGSSSEAAPNRWIRWTLGTSTALLVSGMLFALWWFTPLPPPTVRDVIPITTSGRVDTCWPIVIDGGRLFYLERDGDHWNLLQTSMVGGEPQPVAVPFASNMMVFDVSPDRSQLLVGTFVQRDDLRTMYTMPVQGGPPVRLGAVVANGAKWSPKGGALAFTEGGEVWTSSVDGSNAKLIVSKMSHIEWLNWSPDGLRLRFTSGDPLTSATALWEVDADGRNLHQLLEGWTTPSSERRGAWSTDGRYFVFTSKHDGHLDVWMLREHSDSWRRSPAGPFRLTSGPLSAAGAMMSSDDKRVYFCGAHPSFVLSEFDPVRSGIAPILPQLGAAEAAFSRDAEWLAYVSAGRQLSRSRADGSDHRVLTTGQLLVSFPRVSPDGQTIAFAGQEEGKPSLVYLVSRDGGVLTPLVTEWQDVRDVDWSPDGRELIVSHSEDAAGAKAHVLARIDLQSRHASTIPGSNQLWGSRWSPAGNFIAATAASSKELNVFDIAAQRWRVVATGKDINISEWSADVAATFITRDILSPGEPPLSCASGRRTGRARRGFFVGP